MSRGAHLVWALILLGGGLAFGMWPQAGQSMVGQTVGCGTAWMGVDSATCGAALSGPLTASVLLLVVGVLTMAALCKRVLA